MKSRSASLIAMIAVLTTTAASAASTPQQPDSASSGADASANVKIQFVIGEANVVRVPSDMTTLTATNVAGIEKLAAADLAKHAESIALTDRGVARGAAAHGTFELLKPEFVGRSGANGLTWRVPLKADVPLGTAHSRVLSITYGAPPDAQTFALEYSVSAKPATAAQWTPRGATDVWTVSWSDLPKDRVYGVTVENFDEPLSNLRLAQSTLKDASGHTIGLDRLQLVERPDAAPRSGINVPANSTGTFFVRLESAESNGPFGTFDGVVRLTADGSPVMKDVSVKVQASSRKVRVLGLVLTLGGLALTILLSAWARPQVARLQARRAAAAIREGISQFESELTREMPQGVETPTMKDRASRLAQSVSDKELDRNGLLPPRFALGPGLEAAADQAAALKAKLDEVSKALEGLLILLRSGFPRLIGLLSTNRDAALALIKELDTAAADIAGQQDARTKVEDVLRRIPAMRESGALAVTRGVTVSDIDFRIQSLSSVAWAIWALIALAIAAAWILTDPDYGTPADLVSSFLWGFGMTTLGAGIQNLTPASVATQMNVKVPR